MFWLIDAWLIVEDKKEENFFSFCEIFFSNEAQDLSETKGDLVNLNLQSFCGNVYQGSKNLRISVA